MKNLFSKVESPLEQMATSLDAYSDPSSAFITEGPKFYFGKESGVSPDSDTDEMLGREWDGTHSRNLDTDAEYRDMQKRWNTDYDDLLVSTQDNMEDLGDPDTRSELEKHADALLAGESGSKSEDALDRVDDIGDFDVSDDGDISLPPTDDQLAGSRESDWDFSDLDDPDALISKETPENEIMAATHLSTAAEDLKSIADKLKFFPTDDTAPADVKLALAKIHSDIAALKASLGEGVQDMFDRALELLNEEAGQVVPTSGQVNGVSIISKYQDPTSGEVFVKAVDGRIFCVTVGMNGAVAEVKRTSFNPAFPDAFVRTDKNAIDALGASSTPKL